jgi:predicted dinucleotide-binding enzyme
VLDFDIFSSQKWDRLGESHAKDIVVTWPDGAFARRSTMSSMKWATSPGKLLVDVTNAIDAKMSLALGFTTSGAEELQRKVPQVRVEKAFNTHFAQRMDSGRIGDRRLTLFV